MRVHIYIVPLLLIIDSFPLSPQLLQQWMYKQDLMNRYCGFNVCAILSLSRCTSAQGMCSGSAARIFTARIHGKDGEGTVFTGGCLSTPRVGVPHLYPIILPLVPCSFWVWGYLSDWSQVPSRGYPSDWSQVPSWGYQVPGGGGGVLQSQVGYPSPRWGVPQFQVGVLLPARTGVPPPRQNSQASTWYAAGGMPFTFTQEDCLV